MNELSLFSGAGGGLLASHLLGWKPIAYVEWDDYAQRVLAQRQRDGLLPVAPIYGDIRAFIGEGYAERYRGVADVVSGGFPCTDISCAGKAAGILGEQSGLWFAMLEAVEIVRPRFVFAENAKELRTRGLAEVVEGLTSLGYCVRWGVLGARHVGAPHERKRMWIVADTDDPGQRTGPVDAEVAGTSPNACGPRLADAEGEPLGPGRQSRQPQRVGEAGRNASNPNHEDEPQPQGKGRRAADGRRSSSSSRITANTDSPFLCEQQGRLFGPEGEGSTEPRSPGWWDLPLFTGVDDGVAHRMDRVRCTGNGQVPDVAALAWEVLS